MEYFPAFEAFCSCLKLICSDFRLENSNGESECKQTGRHVLCPMCTRSFSSIYNMVRHVESIHVLSSELSHKCHQCGRVFKSRGNLNTHKKSHSSVCSDCGRVYSSTSSLKVHMQRTHSANKYHCRIENCTFTGTSQQALEYHTNKHTGEKPFKCKHCGKPYPRKDTCSRHQLLCVSGIVCDVCGSKFSSKTCLGDHVRAVHSDRRFRCMCGNVFKYRANLHRHQKKFGHILQSAEVDSLFWEQDT